jgi:hypothetical protein
LENVEEKDRFEDPSVDGRTILKWTFKEFDWRGWMDSCGSE